MMAKTHLLKKKKKKANHNGSGILTHHLEAERQEGYGEPREEEGGTQRCRAKEPRTIKMTHTPLLRFTVRRGQIAGCLALFSLVPAFKTYAYFFFLLWKSSHAFP